MKTSLVARAVTAFIESAATVAAANDNVSSSDIDVAIARTLAERRADDAVEPGRGRR